MDLVTFKTKTVHIKLLRPFVYDQSYTNPRLIANQDKQVFDIVKIHIHKGSTRKASSLTFLTEWADFPNPIDYTWEPWSNLRSNSCLHSYLTSIGLSHLITKAYT
jgi:hypothetical protein